MRSVSAVPPPARPQTRGLALVLGSAVAFGCMAVFAKEAYATGLDFTTLLEARFVTATLIFWAIVAVRHRSGRARFAPSRATVQAGLLLGAVGYAAQSGLYFGALTRIDASLVALLLYLHPVLVVLGALATGRETPGPRTWVALCVASTGGVLVLVGGGIGDLDGIGVGMAIGAAVAYATYILCTDRAAADAEPFALAALITLGASLSFGVAGLLSGTLDPAGALDAAGWIVAIAVVSTVGAVSLFLAGMARVGPSNASIVSTFEPVVTVVLAMSIYGERLGVVQLAGGLLVISAIVVLNTRSRRDATVAPSLVSPTPAARVPAGAA